MPSLIDLRRRVRAVKSTQQITKEMKMVAASRLRRAQERVQQARPFAVEMRRVLGSLASRVDPAAHPLLDERDEPKANGKVLLIVITADRGLCGSFNTNVIKSSGTFIGEQGTRQVALGLVGRRGRDFYARRGFEVRYEQVNLFSQLKFENAQAIARAAIEAHRLERSAAEESSAAEWLDWVSQGAARAPTGAALWLSATSPRDLPAGWDWTVLAPERMRQIPDDRYRLIVSEMTGLDAAHIGRGLEPGGVVVLAAVLDGLQLPESLRTLERHDTDDGATAWFICRREER